MCRKTIENNVHNGLENFTLESIERERERGSACGNRERESFAQAKQKLIFKFH